MSLSSDSAVLTMPVQPANTNGGNGFGFGNDGAWWIIILFLFAFMGNGWGMNRSSDYGQYATAASQQEILFGQQFGQLNDRLTNIGNGICNLGYEMQGNIGQLGKAVSPALDPLGFSWKMDIGLLTGVVAKELVVSTLGVMYASDEPAVSEAVEAADTDVLAADTQLQGTLARSVTLPAAVAYMIFILLYFPCIATFVAIKNETGKKSWPKKLF